MKRIFNKKNIVIITLFIVYFISLKFLPINIYDYFNLLPLRLFCLSPLYFPLYYFIDRIKIYKYERTISKDEIKIEYYRDIINNISPAVLNLIYKGRYRFYRSFKLNLLYLKHKGAIEIENKEIYPNSDFRYSLNMDENLRYTVDNYYSLSKIDLTRKYNLPFATSDDISERDIFRNKVYEDAYCRGLVEERNFSLNPFDNLLSLFLVLNVFLAPLYVENYDVESFFGGITIAIVILLFKYASYRFNKYQKTIDGCILCAKLKALKRFLRRFSNMKDKKLEEIKLWDDYIIYSAMFNNFSNLNKELGLFYEEIRIKINDYKINLALICFIVSTILVFLVYFLPGLGVLYIYLFLPCFILSCKEIKSSNWKWAVLSIIMCIIGYIEIIILSSRVM